MKYLAVGSTVGLDSPAGFVAEGFENFIVIAMFRELVVTVHS